MDFKEIIIAVAVLSVLSIIIGIVLSIAEKVFHTDVNELEVAVRDVLPGSNCGGCGYAGCDSLAKAIAAGEAKVSSCPVGGNNVAQQIAAIMGQSVEETEKKVAYVKCDGTCEKRETDYKYYGINSCTYAAKMPGSSPYACKFGCLGFGTCAQACDHNAIKIVDNKAVIDEELCVACGKCIKACPHNLIEFVPASASHRVQCSSLAKGMYVKDACSAGCIACGICTKNCPSGAIFVENNIAKIDYSKCTHCGICAQKCPRNIIKVYE